MAMNEGRWGIVVAISIMAIIFGAYYMIKHNYSPESCLASLMLITVTPVVSYFVLRDRGKRH
jgi:hypothetical protein